MTAIVKVFTGSLRRVQRGHGKRFTAKAPQPPVRRPARVAIALALAHKIEEAITTGKLRDQAEVARRLGMTRARVTQLLDLVLLAPDIQERVLGLELVDAVQPTTERTLRSIAHLRWWHHQREACRYLSCL